MDPEAQEALEAHRQSLASSSADTRSLIGGARSSATTNLVSFHHFESKVGRSRSVDRTRPLQFDPSAAESIEESGAVAEQDGDEVDLHLVQSSDRLAARASSRPV